MSITQRSLAIAIVIPLSLGLACTKRSGVGRGASSDELLAGPPSAEEPARANGYSSPSSGADPGYAAPPATLHGPSSRQSRRLSESAAASPATARSTPDATEAEAQAWRKSPSPREERPGLATAWGETRRSEVVTVSFQREYPNSPTAVQRIFYNNAAGIAAQTGEHSLSELSPNWTELGRGFVSVEIVNPEGLALPGLTAQGKNYVLGTDGARYSIRIRNHEHYRVEVVATVDGLDVLDGTQGHFNKRGYIIDPQSNLTIDGFRRSVRSVAAFRFGKVSESYAAQTGSDRQVGVIGIAAFPERNCCRNEFSESEVYRRETADPFPGQFARPPQPRPTYHAD